MRTRIAAGLLLAAACGWPAGTLSAAETAGAKLSVDRSVASSTELSSQERRRRPITRLRVYPRYQAPSDGVSPRYYPGANAVRDCSATYVQEYRPSGTVITPRVNCVWRPG